MRLALVSLVLAAFGACVDVEDRPATWEYIHAAIIVPNCATSNCHSNLGASPIGTSVAGIQLDKAEPSFLIMTGRSCEEQDLPEPAGNLVVPGQPASSKLMYQLRGQEVRRMPPDVPLTPAEIKLIERWILEGAPCR